MPVSSASVPPRNPNLPEWSELLIRNATMWEQARSASLHGTRVLIATGTGGGTASAVSAIESLLGVALTLRGAHVEFLLCDQALPACKNLEMVTQPDPAVVAGGDFNQTEFCAHCWLHGRVMFESTQLPVHRISTYVRDEDRVSARARAEAVNAAELAHVAIDGLALGEHAWAGALRYFARGDLNGEPSGEHVARRFLEAALILVPAFTRVLDTLQPAIVLCSHGLYVPHGVFGEVARHMGRRFVTWNIAYRRQCLIFSHHDSYHHTLLDEPDDVWSHQSLSPAAERRLLDYLASRVHGTSDWIWFHEKLMLTADDIWSQHGLGDGRPVIGLLTNVIWDAQLHYRANAFPDMLTWLRDTVDYFARRNDLHLLIRVHPAEVRGTVPSRQRVADMLAQRWPQLPPNVHLVDAAVPVSTYELMDRCDTVLIYGTKTGVELASVGIPILIAGEAWLRHKGVADEASSPAQYRELLDALPCGERLDEVTRDRARRYANHFFFRRMIPVRALRPVEGGWPPFIAQPDELTQLQPGADPGLDVITQGILRGTPFIFHDGL